MACGMGESRRQAALRKTTTGVVTEKCDGPRLLFSLAVSLSDPVPRHLCEVAAGFRGRGVEFIIE